MARELVSGRYNIDFGDLQFFAGGELIAELTFNLKECRRSSGSEERIWEVTVVPSGLDEATRKWRRREASGKELETFISRGRLEDARRVGEGMA